MFFRDCDKALELIRSRNLRERSKPRFAFLAHGWRAIRIGGPGEGSEGISHMERSVGTISHHLLVVTRQRRRTNRC